MARENAEERGGNRRDSAEDSLRVPGALPLGAGQQDAIDVRGQVALGRQHSRAVAWDGYPGHREPVAEQQADRGDCLAD